MVISASRDEVESRPHAQGEANVMDGGIHARMDVARTFVGGHGQLQGEPMETLSGNSQRCCAGKGGGHPFSKPKL